MIQCNEHDPIIKKAFLNYQDELLATISSRGAIHGYTHIQAMPQNQRLQFEAENASVVVYIDNKTSTLFDISIAIGDLLAEANLNTESAFLPVFEAKNFDELIRNLQRFQKKLEVQQSSENQQTSNTSGGWGKIG